MKKYIASVGWSDTCVYAGGSTDCSYEGGSVSDTDASSTATLTDEDSRTSSCRLSRVPLRLVLRERRALEGREAPKKSSTASVVWVSSTETRVARGVCVRAGVGDASCASMSMSCVGVAGRSKRPNKVGREVREDEDATGEDIVG